MKVYIANLDSIGKISDTKLSESELLQSGKFANEIRRNQYVVAHSIIFDIAKEHPVPDKNGKLHLKNGFVSVAHKDNWVVVAFDDNNVGIDIENATIIRDFIAESELLGLGRCDNALDFYKNFVRYESDMKYGTEFENAKHFFYKIDDYVMCVCTTAKDVDFIFCGCGANIADL